MEAKPIKDFNSPEYKSRCIEWALKTLSYPVSAKDVIGAAKTYYDYVYGDDK